MSIPVDCPGCNAHYEAPDKFAGQRMKCKACGTVLTVPASELELLDDAPPAAAPPKPPARPTAAPGASPSKTAAARPAAPQPPARSAAAVPAAAAPAAFAPRPLDDLLDDAISTSQGKTAPRPAGGKVKMGASCPECSQPMDPEDIVCVECGYNIVKKKSMKKVEPKKKKKKSGSYIEGGGSSGGGSRGPVPDDLSQVFQIDIVLCVLRWGGMAVLFFVIGGYIPVEQTSGREAMLAFSVGALVVLAFGIFCNAMMLSGKSWGWIMGYLFWGFTVLLFVPSLIALVSGGAGRLIGLGGAIAIGLFGIQTYIYIWYFKGVTAYKQWVQGGGRSRQRDSDY